MVPDSTAPWTSDDLGIAEERDRLNVERRPFVVRERGHGDVEPAVLRLPFLAPLPQDGRGGRRE